MGHCTPGRFCLFWDFFRNWGESRLLERCVPSDLQVCLSAKILSKKFVKFLGWELLSVSKSAEVALAQKLRGCLIRSRQLLLHAIWGEQPDPVRPCQWAKSQGTPSLQRFFKHLPCVDWVYRGQFQAGKEHENHNCMPIWWHHEAYTQHGGWCAIQVGLHPSFIVCVDGMKFSRDFGMLVAAIDVKDDGLVMGTFVCCIGPCST